MQEKARLAVKDLCVGAVANECKDTKFTGYKIAYETLPDKRRRCNIFMIGVSGGGLSDVHRERHRHVLIYGALCVYT